MALQVEHIGDLPQQSGEPTSFTGTTHIQSVVSSEGPVAVARVTFEKGARTFWHVHSGEQVLYFLEGRGRVQVRGEQPVDASEGDIVRIPAGAEHWHGAHPEEEHRMRHLAITFGRVTWLDPVSDEDYRAG